MVRFEWNAVQIVKYIQYKIKLFYYTICTRSQLKKKYIYIHCSVLNHSFSWNDVYVKMTKIL